MEATARLDEETEDRLYCEAINRTEDDYRPLFNIPVCVCVCSGVNARVCRVK